MPYLVAQLAVKGSGPGGPPEGGCIVTESVNQWLIA